MRSATQTPVQFSRRSDRNLVKFGLDYDWLNLLFSSSVLVASSLSLGLPVVDFLVVAGFLVVELAGGAGLAAGRFGCGFGLGLAVVLAVVVVRLVVLLLLVAGVVLRCVVLLLPVVLVVILGVVAAVAFLPRWRGF